MKIKEEVKQAIDQSFTKNHLTTGYWPYVQKIFNNPKFFISDKKIQDIFEKKNKNKEDLVTLVAGIFSNDNLFKEFLTIIPEAARKLFGILVWEDYFLHEEMIRSEYGIDIVETRSGSGWSKDSVIKSEFYLFSHSREYDWSIGYQYFVGLLPELRKEIAGYFEKPKDYFLQIVEEVPAELKQFNAEELIFQELPRLLVYANQGHIKLSNTGIPVASTFSKMRKSLSLKEFHEGNPKPYDTLRTSLIATLVSECGSPAPTQDGLRTLNELFTCFIKRFYPLHLLQHLKGTGYIDNRKKYKIGDVLMGILREFPEEGGWVSMENILRFSRYRSLNLKPAEDYLVGRHLYFSVQKRGYTDKVSISARNYYRLIKKPLLQASFYLFAAFGLVEAAYEEPVLDRREDELFTPYETLRYVRLTSLGEYLAGRTGTYSPPETVERAKIQLLEDSLNILSDKPSETIDLLLDNYTVKVGQTRYRTDFGIFMKGIRNGEELESKISLFMQTVTNKLPPIWQTFFNTLRLKCDPLKSIGAHEAFQLPKEDKELIGLVAKDPVLKNLAIKAEGLIILVMKNDLTKFKNRLKEFGYLLE